MRADEGSRELFQVEHCLFADSVRRGPAANRRLRDEYSEMRLDADHESKRGLA